MRVPDLRDDVAPRDKRARIVREHGQEVELLRGEGDLLAVDEDAVLSLVEEQGSNRLLFDRGGLGERTTPDRTDARGELTGAEGLDDVVVRTELESRHAVDLVVARRDDDDRDRSAGSKRTEHLETVSVGQPEVEQHEVVRLGGRRLLRSPCARHVEPLPHEALEEGSPDRVVIFDQQHPHGSIIPRRRIAGARASPRHAHPYAIFTRDWLCSEGTPRTLEPHAGGQEMTTVANRPPRTLGARTRRVLARPAPPQHPVVVRLAVILLGVGFGATLALTFTAESRSQLSAAGGTAMFLGSLAGMAGTYLALVMVLLVSRVPVVERVLGQDGLLRVHRRLAPWPLTLIAAHVVLLTLAYAQAAHTGPIHEFNVMNGTFPDVLIATVGFGIMMAIGIVSIRAIRTRIPRERWWALHLGMYLALALSFAHVIALGPSFVNHPLTQLLWTLLWVGTAGLVLCYRVGLPLLRTLRHRLEVVDVREEGPGVISIRLRGRNLDRLAVSGGQFFEWRFLTPSMWWQAHPFSLSALPRPPYLRLTVKGVGDFTTALRRLRPGTRVAIEGPYGVLTADTQVRPKAVLIAGGIGVTAIRALLEDLPLKSDPVVILRASREEDLIHADEVEELVRHRKGRVHPVVGPRSMVALEHLDELVPDLRLRDVYVAGPDSFVHRVVDAVERHGVPTTAIHAEVYAL